MNTSKRREPVLTHATDRVRRLHLIDIENEVGGWVTAESCREFAAQYLGLGIVGTRDLVVVGVSPGSMAATFTLPGGWRRVLGPRGPQSADLALLAAEPQASMLSTFSELVVASADHAFLGTALRARRRGLAVTVVTNRSSVPHWKLYVAAHRHLTVAVRPTVRGAAA